MTAPGVATAQAPRPVDLAPEEVQRAIDRGIEYIKTSQKADGTWPDNELFGGGLTPLCTLALLNAGVGVEDDSVRRALGHLRQIELSKTYAVALQTMVFCAARPQKDLALIRRNVKWLERTQIDQGQKKGSWGYPSAGGDHSNAQFALLALHEAERVGVAAGEQTWRLALAYWTGAGVQNGDGSFGYQPGMSGTGSMTCAGIGALIISSGSVHSGDARVIDGRVQCCGEQEELTELARAVRWLGQKFDWESNPGDNQYWLYYMYGVERVGRLTAQRFIGPHDWYRAGAAELLKRQNSLGKGYWKSNLVESNELIATSFALLFLSKGRRPVLCAKLMHGPGDDWNHHRADLAHLTSYVETSWRKNLTWQIIDPAAASVDDLLQSPVLFFNGQSVPEFTVDQIERLRQYVDGGGFLFACASCGGDEFDRGFRALIERMFEEDEYQLRLLPPEHPIWTADQRVDPQYLRPLWGIDLGCRTSVVYCPEDLSCYWELSHPRRLPQYPAEVRDSIAAANAIGANVLAYATGRELQFKDEIPRTLTGDDPADRFERAKLYIAKLQHSGGSEVAPNALTNLLRFVSVKAGMRVSLDDRQLPPSDDRVFNYPLLFMHGRHSFRFSGKERNQLRRYVERGGVLLVDSVCASEAFTAAFRKEMAAIFPTAPLSQIPPTHAMFTSQYGGFDLSTVTLREPSRGNSDSPLTANTRQIAPRLEGVELEGRYGVIFSPYDLSCALEKHESLECKGYTREDAARIGLNAVLYAIQQ